MYLYNRVNAAPDAPEFEVKTGYLRQDNIGTENLQLLMNTGTNRFDRYGHGIFEMLSESDDLETFRSYVDLIGRENLPKCSNFTVVTNLRILKFMIEELKIRPIDINELLDPTMFAFEKDRLDSYQYLTGLGYNIYNSEFVSRDYRELTAEIQSDFIRKIRKFGIDIRKLTSDRPTCQITKEHTAKTNRHELKQQWTVLDVMLTRFPMTPEFIKLIREQRAGALLSSKRPVIQTIIKIGKYPSSTWLREINSPNLKS